MQSKFVTDTDVLNNISDDLIYLRELVERERKSLNFLKESHLARLVIVFVATGMEAYRDIQARSLFSKNSMSWESFFKEFYGNETVQSWSDKLGLQKADVEMKVYAIKSLRDIIAHGLIDESAKNFAGKVDSIGTFLPVNPSKLKIEHIDKVLEFDTQFVNLIGGGSSLMIRK